MKKNAVLYHVLGLFLCPLFFISMFTLISSVATVNYEYLPESLDGMSVFFYELAAYALDFVLFFVLGAFAYALSQKKTVPAVLCGGIALFHSFLLPMIQFFVRSLFLASSTDADIMEDYFEIDVATSEVATLKAVAGILICAAVAIVFFARKKNSDFAKPYIAPVSMPSIAALIICGALIVYTIIFFTVIGEYDLSTVLRRLIEIAIYIATYFVMVLGSYTEKKFLPRNKAEISTLGL